MYLRFLSVYFFVFVFFFRAVCGSSLGMHEELHSICANFYEFLPIFLSHSLPRIVFWLSWKVRFVLGLIQLICLVVLTGRIRGPCPQLESRLFRTFIIDYLWLFLCVVVVSLSGSWLLFPCHRYLHPVIVHQPMRHRTHGCVWRVIVVNITWGNQLF